MSQLTPMRCPFLLGELGGDSFDARANGKKVKVSFKCSQNRRLFNARFDTFPTENGCLDGNYLSCQWYAKATLKLSSQIPNLCPLSSEETEECTVNNKKCERYWIDSDVDDQDYRDCIVFSRWFWEQVTKSQSAGNSKSGAD